MYGLRFLLLCSLFSCITAKDYEFNFFVGKEKLTIRCSDGLATLSIDNEMINCHCGKTPVTVLKMDNQIFAQCEDHQGEGLFLALKKSECCTEDNEKCECSDVDFDEIRPRSHKKSSHRNFEG